METTPTGGQGVLGCMAVSVEQYLCVCEVPSLLTGWLDTVAVQESVLEYQLLLVAAAALHSVKCPRAFKSALAAFVGVAKAYPSLVRIIMFMCVQLITCCS